MASICLVLNVLMDFVCATAAHHAVAGRVVYSWWRHDMETTLFAVLALCEGYPPMTAMWILYYVSERPNKMLIKRWSCLWIGTAWRLCFIKSDRHRYIKKCQSQSICKCSRVVRLCWDGKANNTCTLHYKILVVAMIVTNMLGRDILRMNRLKQLSFDFFFAKC